MTEPGAAVGIGDQYVGIHHVGLSVRSLKAMQEWYARALGFTVDGEFEIPDVGLRAVVMTRGDGGGLELIEVAGSTSNPHLDSDPVAALRIRGFGHLALQVTDIDDAHAALLAVGAREVAPPAASFLPGLRYSYVADPEGNQIELLEELERHA